MVVLTNGLRALAGEALQEALTSFTKSPLSGAVTGSVSTAILQSSSATTVAAVGFVSAGILSFPQALGIIFGANIGTTITGWLVTLFGFKLQLGTLVLPLIFLGVITHLFAKNRLASGGLALAGFGLIFVGISQMQLGMSGLENVIDFDALPTGSLGGQLLLVALGIIMTIITQSSSAGVAATLTALFAGSINFEQAAALVIGMDVGTTVTAAIAALGGSVSSKRTGLSHVIYNLFTATGALLLISPFILFWQHFLPGELENNAEIALVAFHTLFNTLGVIIILPFTSQFANLIEKLIPEKETIYTRSLDTHLLSESGIALKATRQSIKHQLLALISHTQCLLANTSHKHLPDLLELQNSLDRVHHYIDQIHLKNESDKNWQILLAQLHSLDHMQRLHERCEEDFYRAKILTEANSLEDIRNELLDQLNKIIQLIQDENWATAYELTNTISSVIQNTGEKKRNDILSQMAKGKFDVDEATDRVEAIRWLTRVSFHISRILYHINNAKT